MKHVTIITPTGHRPAAINLLKKYIEAQSFPGDITWIIVNDGAIEHVPFGSTNRDGVETIVLKATTPWQPGYNTQRLNWIDALKRVPKNTEAIFCMEDDDYYAPEYISVYTELLKAFDLVGEGNNKYYYVPGKCYKEMKNYSHTSLSSCAFIIQILPTFLKALHSGQVFFDITFWEQAQEDKVKSILFVNQNLSIGMKGLPGRPGIGVGHVPENYTSDPFFETLDEWCRDSANNYVPFMPEKFRRKI